MYSILIVIHVIISLFLIAVILLQAGRGGGLADSFGGSQMQNLFGTKSATVLTRLTAICAIGFIVTCLSLAYISSHRARSILDSVRIPQPQAAPATQAPSPAAGPVQNAAPAPAEAQTQETATQGGTNEVK